MPKNNIKKTKTHNIVMNHSWMMTKRVLLSLLYLKFGIQLFLKGLKTSHHYWNQLVFHSFWIRLMIPHIIDFILSNRTKFPENTGLYLGWFKWLMRFTLGLMFLFKNVLKDLCINLSLSFHAHCGTTSDPFQQVQHLFSLNVCLFVYKENWIWLPDIFNFWWAKTCKSTSI